MFGEFSLSSSCSGIKMLLDRGTSLMKQLPGRSVVVHPTEIGVGKAECVGSGIQKNRMTVAGISYIFCHVGNLELKGLSPMPH
jgi:hypothetical protein